MSLAGKVAIVTGSATGIGEATAILFAKEGAKVAVADINQAGAEKTIDQIKKAGGEAFFLPLDVTKAENIEEAVKTTVDKYGKLDIFIANAGSYHPASAINMTEEWWDMDYNVNIKGVWLCAKYAIPEMIKAGGGAFISTASTVGILANTENCSYDSTKAAVIMLTKQMALDYSQFKVRVNCVCPGFVATPMVVDYFNAQPDPAGAREATEALHPAGRMGEPIDIAHAFLYLASDEASWVCGSALIIDGGLICHV